MTARPLTGATVEDREGQTIGGRIYLIREALQTRRDPLPLDKFAALIAETTGVVWDKSTLSRMETGDRKVLPEDVAIIAQVDPLKRGRSWLAWGDDDEGQQGAPLNHTPGPLIGPTVHTTPVVQSSRLDDPPAPQQGKTVRRPRGRSAVA
jgi:hypothetical protein